MDTNVMTNRYFRSALCLICTLAVAFVFTAEQSFAAPSIKKIKVSGVKARVVADNTVRVSWNKRSGVKGYTVYVSTKKNRKFKARVTVGKKANAADVRNLKIGEIYYFKVRPYGGKGKKKYGKYSKRVSCAIAPAPPTIDASAVRETTSRIRIKLTRSRGASGYNLYRATSAGGSYKLIKTLASTTREIDDIGLLPNRNYYYKIRPFVKNKKKKVYFGGYSNVATDVTGGNSKQYDLSRTPYINSKLKGKKILFLGSSITLGSASEGISFVEYLKKQDGISVVKKEAQSGTTISFKGDNNYCVRLEKEEFIASGAQLVFCQLSSNDARIVNINDIRRPIVASNPNSGNDANKSSQPNKKGYTDEQILKELRDNASAAPYHVDDAIKYIIAYSNLKLECPVTFYVIPPFKNTGVFNADFYKEMRNALLEVQASWSHKNGNLYGKEFKVSVIDLWTNNSFSSFYIYDEKRNFYMKDSVHPTRAGYYEKFVPVFREFLKNDAVWNMN